MSDIKKPVVLGLRRTWRFAGAPVDGTEGTLAGVCDKGDLLIDVDNAVLYQNVNTKESPTWNSVRDVVTAEIGDLQVTTGKLAANAVTSDKMDTSVIQVVDVAISSADILAMYTTPIELVPTPGSGKFLELISCTLILKYGTTPYATEGLAFFGVHYTDENGEEASSSIRAEYLIKKEEDFVYILQADGVQGPGVDEPLVLVMADEDPTAGDSTVLAQVVYRVHETGL